MMSRSERPIPPCSTSGSCSGLVRPAAAGSGSAIGLSSHPRGGVLAVFCGPRLATGATPVDDQVGVADHEAMLVGDVMQHRDHVVALDVEGRAALIANQVVMVGPLLRQLVIGTVADPGLLDEFQLLQYVE